GVLVSLVMTVTAHWHVCHPVDLLPMNGFSLSGVCIPKRQVCCPSYQIISCRGSGQSSSSPGRVRRDAGSDLKLRRHRSLHPPEHRPGSAIDQKPAPRRWTWQGQPRWMSTGRVGWSPDEKGCRKCHEEDQPGWHVRFCSLHLERHRRPQSLLPQTWPGK